MIATPSALLPLAAGLVGAGVIGQAPPSPYPAPPPVVPPGTERGEEFGKTSPLALVVILLLLLATVLLIRSMSKRLRNVPASFDAPPETVATPGAGSADTAGTTDSADTAAADAPDDTRRRGPGRPGESPPDP